MEEGKKSDELSETEKAEKYLDGKYYCPTPPVTTSRWTPLDWVRWIDHCGKWRD